MVQAGDSWYRIAANNGVSLDALLAANGATVETTIFLVAGKVADLAEGVELARSLMRDGSATRQLSRIAACSQRLQGNK